MNTPATFTHPSIQARLCVLLTCFNRKEKTLACFRALAACSLPQGVTLFAVLVDDGSTDGTPEAMRAEFPWIQIVHGSGNLFWCRGMYQAFEVAMQADYDYYLWLNDDTMLQSDALQRLLIAEQQLSKHGTEPVVVVGSTVDEHTKILTYGGEVRASAIKRTRFMRLQPSDVAQRCDSMNGNIVLLSKQSVQIIGNVDRSFEHAMGDTDYALRAVQLGVQVWTAPGVHGTCSGNSRAGTYMDTTLSLRQRWKLMLGRKGLPWRSWLVLTRRHTGLLWPMYFAWPYVSLWVGRYRAAP